MKYFKIDDFRCKQTGENEMDPDFLMRLDMLRELCGFPFIVISGFRSVKHSVEVKKVAPGEHTRGIAVDIRVSGGVQRRAIAKQAFALGFTGIGIYKRWVHVDMRTSTPMMWAG